LPDAIRGVKVYKLPQEWPAERTSDLPEDQLRRHQFDRLRLQLALSIRAAIIRHR